MLHTVCEKHFVQRIKAIYEEGRYAFDTNEAQRCFLCRTHMEDKRFSATYHKNVKVAILFGLVTIKVEKSNIPRGEQRREQRRLVQLLMALNGWSTNPGART